MINITHSRYRPICNIIYLSECGEVIGVNPYAIKLFHRVQCINCSESSDTSHGIYPRAAFMTVFALNPEAIIQGWLLYIKTTAIITELLNASTLW